MSRSLRCTAVSLMAAVLIPAAVAAAPAVAAPAPAPSAAGVADHVRSATKASKRVTKYVRRGNDRAALRFLKEARREAVSGAREARSLAARAGTSPTAAGQAIFGLTAAAATYGAATKDFSPWSARPPGRCRPPWPERSRARSPGARSCWRRSAR